MFTLATDVSLARDGRLLVADQTQNALFAIDVETGDRTIFSSNAKTAGDPFGSATRFTVGPNYDIVVADWAGRLVDVNPATGVRTTISATPLFDTLIDISLGTDGQLITSHPFNKQIFQTNYDTGNTTILSATPISEQILDRGDGPALNYAVMTTVVPPVSEPASEFISLVATVDGQASCTLQSCRVQDGDFGIQMFRFDAFDDRGVLEFDLSGVAEDTKIKSASLKLQVSGSGSNSTGQISEVVLHGYRGDAALADSDATNLGRIVGGSLTNGGEQSILLDTEFVQELLDDGSDLGILMLPGNNAISTSFSAREFLDQFPDFPNTISPTLVLELTANTLLGDFNNSGQIEATDLDFLCAAIQSGSITSATDINRDGSLSQADFNALLVSNSIMAGDTDLDGEVRFSDFLNLSANFGTPGGWSAGDFDCTGSVGFSDFLALSTNFGQLANAISIPEPSGNHLALALVMLLLATQRCKQQ